MVAATTRREAGFDERIGAGRRAAGDAAGLERDVGRAAVDAVARVLAGLAEGDDFGVVEEIVLVPALADDLAGAVENDAADGGVGRGDADAAARELEGARIQWRSRSDGIFMRAGEEQSSLHWAGTAENGGRLRRTLRPPLQMRDSNLKDSSSNDCANQFSIEI